MAAEVDLGASGAPYVPVPSGGGRRPRALPEVRDPLNHGPDRDMLEHVAVSDMVRLFVSLCDAMRAQTRAPSSSRLSRVDQACSQAQALPVFFLPHCIALLFPRCLLFKVHPLTSLGC
jgi:hypothetical protein